MKKFLFRRLPRGGTMRTRLILSFSVPVLAVMLLVLAGVHSILLSGSETQVLSTARSSYDQAYELATSYIELMLYASDSIYYNGDLQRIFEQPRLSRGDVRGGPLPRVSRAGRRVFDGGECGANLPHGHLLNSKNFRTQTTSRIIHAAGNAFRARGLFAVCIHGAARPLLFFRRP